MKHIRTLLFTTVYSSFPMFHNKKQRPKQQFHELPALPFPFVWQSGKISGVILGDPCREKCGGGGGAWVRLGPNGRHYNGR